MDTCIHIVLLTCLLFSLFSPPFVSAQVCVSETFSSNKLYASCNSLTVLGATLHWTYHPSNGTTDVAYRIQQATTGWVAWAINPKMTGMLGSNTLFAYHDSTSGAVKVVSTVINDYMPTVRDENLTFAVYNRSAEYSNGTYTIYASIQLPGNKTTQNITWQAGTDFTGGAPGGHNLGPPNMLASTSIDFLSGASVPVPSPASDNRLRQKNIHGILNTVAWGIILPVGVLKARYIKSLNPSSPAWFHVHKTCQSIGYIIGVAGFALGLKLGSESKGITHHGHRIMAIVLFCFATIQVSALLLRPKPTHKRRIYWNAYHYSVGILVITLGIFNIFSGFNILNPDSKWRRLYVVVICVIAGIAPILEVCKWTMCRNRESRSYTKPENVPSEWAVTA
ncbi:Cytochrome b561 and DOMON domain-containing protein [Rhynchospora pubera]|uniref:Cytochrome b561 and DOMON domain-containing protein n=1 Tax=Rhynchospora pubera TaxID=906938 RepID=A0AAV8HBN7_9POAL|nr:Cytochrome b561 and DOMON domain-containing protein [Rhynchospora pubera]